MKSLTSTIIEIITWILQIFAWKKKEIKEKPYEEISNRRTKFGVLRKVRRDTPRAVLTYIYTPYADSENVNQLDNKNNYDIHICLDHLWAIDIEDRGAAKTKIKRHHPGDPSHEFNILRASRFRDKNGRYVIKDIVFSEQFDFVGKDNDYRDRLAIAIISSVVNDLVYKKFEQIDWHTDISIAKRAYMGKHYYETPKERLEREKRQAQWLKEENKTTPR